MKKIGVLVEFTVDDDVQIDDVVCYVNTSLGEFNDGFKPPEERLSFSPPPGSFRITISGLVRED